MEDSQQVAAVNQAETDRLFVMYLRKSNVGEAFVLALAVANTFEEIQEQQKAAAGQQSDDLNSRGPVSLLFKYSTSHCCANQIN